MQIDLPDQTVYDIRAMLALKGDGSDVSAFVNRTVQRALFFATVREVKQHNADVDPEKLDRLIDEAVSAVRSENNGATINADGA